MLADKTVRYQGRNTDLKTLTDEIVTYLQADGFKVQTPNPNAAGWLIQAQKGGFLRELITAERAFNIMIKGRPDDFTVRIGIGKWLQNIGVVGVETLVLSELFLPLDVAEMAWTVEVERNILKKVDEFAGAPHTLIVPGSALFAEGTVTRITGAHKLIVEPRPEDEQVKVGDEVRLVSADSEFMLGTISERRNWPYTSEWAIIVKGKRTLERCNVSIDGTKLQAFDSAGAPQYTLPLNGVLSFH